MARRRPEPPSAPPLRLVASGARSLRLGDTTAPPPRQDWQDEAWDYYDSVPEVKQTVLYIGNAMSKLRLYVAVRPSSSDEPVPVGQAVASLDGEAPLVVLPDQLVADAEAELARLHGPTGEVGDILRALNANLEVAGEAFLVGYGARSEARTDPATMLPVTVTTPERWEVRSKSEVTYKAPARTGGPPVVEVRDAPGSTKPRVLDPEQDAIIRIWQPHPRWQSWPDCSLKGALSDCAVLKVLTQQQIGEGWSHLNAGFFCAPNDLSFGARPMSDGSPVPEGQDDDEDQFTKALMEYLVTPIRDPASAAGVVPAVIRGAPESLTPDVLRWVDIGRGRTELINAAMEAKATRLARGLNVPPEVMLGHQQTTFANAEQVDLDTFDDYLKPRAELLAAALTAHFLRPALAEDHDPALVEQLIVWYDASELITETDPSESAEAAWADGIISDAARRRVQGFDEGDAPSVEERLLNTALRRGIFTTDLTVALLAEGGVDVDVASVTAELTEAEAAAVADGDAPLAAAIAVLRQSPALVSVLAAAAAQEAPTAASEGSRGRRPFAPAPLALPAASTVMDLPGRRLVDIDRQLRERLLVAADAAMTRALERAGNRIKGTARAEQRATLRRVPARHAAATLGRPLVAAAFTEADLLAGAWDSLHSQFKAWGRNAQGDALDVVGSVVGGFTREQRDALGLRQAADLDEAWDWFRGALDAVAGDRLFDPDPAAPEFGEFDPTLKVPSGLVRRAMARAGGQTQLEQGVAGAWLAITPSGEPAGGIGTGKLVQDTLRENGAGIDGYRWVYGPAIRSRPFPPHVALDGLEFVSFTDSRLRNSSGFPALSYYLPGDHVGCVCDVEPVLIDPDTFDKRRLRRARSERKPKAAPSSPLGPTMDGSPSHLDALRLAQGVRQRGAGFGFDGGDIERLGVAVRHLDVDGTPGVEYRMKLTDDGAGRFVARQAGDDVAAAAAKARTGGELVDVWGSGRHPLDDAMAAKGWQRGTTTLRSQQFEEGFRGRARLGVDAEPITLQGSRLEFDSETSVTWRKTVRVGDIDVIAEWTEVADGAHAPYALRNQVKVWSKGVLDDDGFARAMREFDLTDQVSHPGALARRSYAEDALLTRLAGGRRAGTLGVRARKAALDEIEQVYGITPDDVIFSTDVAGRLTATLPEQAVQRLVDRTKVTSFKHSISYGQNMPEKMATILGSEQGGLASTTRRLDDGHPFGGMSSFTDLTTGGADYVFTRQERWPALSPARAEPWTLHYRNSALRRLDWHAYRSDTFGATNPKAHSDAYGKTDFVEALTEGSRSSGGQETMFRDVLGWEDLEMVVVPTDADRADVIARLRAVGVDDLGGRPLEDVITTQADTEPRLPAFTPAA